MFLLPPEMLKAYLQRRYYDLQALQQGLNDNSAEPFHRIGHQLSGSAKNYGFESLEVLAKKFEDLKSSELLKLGPQLIEEFSAWIDSNSKKNLNITK